MDPKGHRILVMILLSGGQRTLVTPTGEVTTWKKLKEGESKKMKTIEAEKLSSRKLYSTNILWTLMGKRGTDRMAVEPGMAQNACVQRQIANVFVTPVLVALHQQIHATCVRKTCGIV
jgi:hypothetical protein